MEMILFPSYVSTVLVEIGQKSHPHSTILVFILPIYRLDDWPTHHSIKKEIASHKGPNNDTE